MLTLKGQFYKVTKYGKLKFRYTVTSRDDYSTRLIKASQLQLGDIYGERIRRMILDADNRDSSDTDSEESSTVHGDECDNTAFDTSNLHLPFDDRYFTVTLPKWIKTPPRDITNRVGMVCTVEVKVMKYDFTSTAKHNKGDHIVGVQLMLVKVIKGEL